MAILVPRVFHRIWIGGRPMPEEYVAFGKTWLDHHPGWEMKLWTEENLSPSHYPELIKLCKFYRTQANIHRYEILLREGGIYIDTDFECQRNLEPLIQDAEWFTAHVDHPNHPGLLANGFFGCVPNHPISWELVNLLPQHFDSELHLNVGPHYFTDIIHGHREAKIFEARFFYPYVWTELDRKEEAFPDAYAIHHWGSHRYDGSRLPIKDLPPPTPRSS